MSEMNESKLTRETTPLSSINSNSYPSNTERAPGREKLESIVKGRVIQRKKSIGQRFKESFLGDNSNGSVGDYLLYDIFIPAVKSTLSDIISSGVEMLLFGERRHRPDNVRRDRNRSYVSYTSYYNGRDDSRGRPSEQRPTIQPHDRYNFEEIIFSSRGEAEDVLSKLSELVEDYGLVSVADFFDLCGLQSSFTDNKYGWTSLKEAFTERIRDGYVIRLPRARPLS
jgi:hypothetical protein